MYHTHHYFPLKYLGKEVPYTWQNTVYNNSVSFKMTKELNTLKPHLKKTLHAFCVCLVKK